MSNKKSFLISPVRGYEQKPNKALVRDLESEGYIVHYPARDTNQIDDTGLQICKDNMEAIKNADVIHFVWDGKSQGSLFDLGMAFALNKRIIPLLLPELSEGKSFQNMVTALFKQQNTRSKK